MKTITNCTRFKLTQLIKFPASSVLLAMLSACGSGDESQPPATGAPLLEEPGILIQSPEPGFVRGQALDMGAPLPGAQAYTVRGFVRVLYNNGNDNTPLVTVNQETAAVSAHAFAPDCPTTEPYLCFQFEQQISLDRGKHTIVASATDANGASYTQELNGIVDYCRKGGFDPGVPALFQTDPNAAQQQNNRCHEIDGCSVYITATDPLASSQTRNNPASTNNSKRAASTAFGSGDVPPSEYFVHGQLPTEPLPCNIHDVCYQTINGKTQKQCDNQMLSGMMDVCEQAYPGDCPAELNTLECIEWKGQRETCEAFANSYHLGLTAVGASVFDDRQAEYR